MAEGVRGRVVSGQYRDSVFLMRIGEALRQIDGVAGAGVVMGTPANREMLGERSLIFEGLDEVAADDIIVAVRGRAEVLDGALDVAEAMIAAPLATESWERYGSIESALRSGQSISAALVSIPGEYVAEESMQLVEAGIPVMIFSDNVSLEDEIILKREARRRRSLVMGPDCGTAIIDGVALGFANAVPRGAVGVIAASGTGAQVVATKVAELGEGISHLIGLGGRDLADSVGGLAFASAWDALERDPETEVIVLVAKSCGPRVLGRLLRSLPEFETPLVVHMQGPGPWSTLDLAGAVSAPSLASAAKAAVCVLRRHRPARPVELEGLGEAPGAEDAALRGYFAGGTLAAEALVVAEGVLGPVRSNLTDRRIDSRHQILDMGADEYTVNQPHPMIAPNTQADSIRRAGEEEGPVVVLFDVVLGYGAHEDPAGVLAVAVEDVRARRPRDVRFFASCVGTSEDPQGHREQVAKLRLAGVDVRATSELAALAAALTASGKSDGPSRTSVRGGLRRPGAVVNVGAPWFAEALRRQDVPMIQVDWQPKAGGNKELAAILDQLM